MDSFPVYPEDDEKHYDSEPEDIEGLMESMDSFPVAPEDYEQKSWEMFQKKHGPEPQDPDSEAMKEYLEDLWAYNVMDTPLGEFEPLALDHEYAQDGARFAVEEYNKTHEGQVLELKRVVKAMLSSCDVEITLETSDGKFYLASVVAMCNSWMPYSFRDFKPLDTNPDLEN